MKQVENSFSPSELPAPWRIGQMAGFFGISVQTLRHYDRIGLFRPEVRDPFTDYRYYSYRQVYQLAGIVFLRKQGYSLAEIKDGMQKASIAERLENLKDQAAHLDRERLRLESSSRALKDRLDYILASDYREICDEVEVACHDGYSYVEIGLEHQLFPSELFYFFPTIVHFRRDCSDFGAYILNREHFESFLLSLPTRDMIESKIRHCPAGRVLRGFYRGPYEQIGGRLEELKEEAARRRLTVDDYSVHFNIIDQFIARDPRDYVTEIHLPLL